MKYSTSSITITFEFNKHIEPYDMYPFVSAGSFAFVFSNSKISVDGDFSDRTYTSNIKSDIFLRRKSMGNSIFLIVGESGSGKTTIADLLENMYGLKVLKSYTTRPPRINDNSHIFINDNEFNNLTDIVAYTKYNGYRYCATADQINNSDLYVIDPYGVETLKANYHGDKKLIDIYVRVPEDIRVSRMRYRGDTEDQIISRLINDRRVFVNYYPTYTIDNNKEGLDYAVDTIKKIIDQCC